MNSHVFKLLSFSMAALLGMFQLTFPNHVKFQSVIDDKNIEMILIPSGEFRAGATLETAIDFCSSLYGENNSDLCNFTTFSERYLVDQPGLTTVNEFYLDKYEVTIDNYLNCVNADVCNLEPVEQEYYYRLAEVLYQSYRQFSD